MHVNVRTRRGRQSGPRTFPTHPRNATMKPQLGWRRLVPMPSRRSVILAKMHGFLFAAIMTFGLSGEAFAAPVEKTELRYQGWAGQVVFPELAEDLGYLAPLRAQVGWQHHQRPAGHPD